MTILGAHWLVWLMASIVWAALGAFILGVILVEERRDEEEDCDNMAR